MHLERALRVLNLLDVPEVKRKFWPQHAVVVIDSGGEILDIIQHFDPSGIDVAQAHRHLYPAAVMFFAWPGLFTETADLKAKIEWALKPPDDRTYVIGKS